MSHSTYLADKLNDHVLKGATYTPPTDVYIALFTSSGGLDNNTGGSQTEISGGAYGRLLINNVAKAFTASAAKNSTNNEEWAWVTATADWGTISHVAIMDASTAGNVLYWGALSVAKLVETDDTFRFLAGALDSVYS